MAGEVKITSNVHALVELLNGEVEDVIRDELDTHVQSVYVNAVAQWPRDTGFSVGEFKLERFGEGWRFRNNARYAGFILKGEVAERLIFRPLNEGMIPVAQRIAERVSRIGR